MQKEIDDLKTNQTIRRQREDYSRADPQKVQNATTPCV